jgi:hypothetical protein
MRLLIDRSGVVRCLYSETIELSSIGLASIQRASHVEPDENCQWWADLSPVAGPKLGPFLLRSQALDAERNWLETNRLSVPSTSISSLQ